MYTPSEKIEGLGFGPLPRETGNTQKTPLTDNVPPQGVVPRLIRRKAIVALFCIALIARVGSALFLHSYCETHREFLDEQTYDRAGWELATHWRTGDTFVLGKDYKSLSKGYLIWLAALYYVFGHHILIPKVCNALIGAVIVLFIYRAARFFTSEKAAFIAASLYAVWPSCIFWASLNLKMTWIVALITSGVAAFFSLMRRFSVTSLIVATVTLWLLYYFQRYSAGFLLFIYPVTLLFIRPLCRHVTAVRLLFAALGLCFFLVFFYYLVHPFFAFVNIRDFTWLSIWRDRMTVDNSAFMKGVDLSTPLSILKFLPVGLFYFFFAPFPANVTNVRLMAAFLENIVWYPLFMAGVIGIWRVCRRKDSCLFGIAALLYCLGMACGFALMEGNIGSFIRHRFQVIPLYFMFTGAGIAYLTRRDAQKVNEE
ncbi:MAG: hypothetical protein JW844_04280 [Candidatus Omnitrophica bacterium]|nr:hypothetical protein [Candidatus Omnitrophota bacterium]